MVSLEGTNYGTYFLVLLKGHGSIEKAYEAGI